MALIKNTTIMENSIPAYDISERFPVRWNDDEKIFTAMASDMQFAPGQWPRKIHLVNSNTDKKVEFVRMFSKTSPQGELESYHYEAMSLSSLANAFGPQRRADFSLTIFND